MVFSSIICTFAIVLYRLKRCIVWLTRWKYCQGFGVQSPWAYRLIRQVINDHTDFAAYEELRHAYPNLNKRTRKLYRLYYRIAKSYQPHLIYIIGETDPSANRARQPLYAYIQAGNADTKITEMLPDEVHRIAEGFDISILPASPSCHNHTLQIARKADNHSLLVVEHIHRNKTTRAQWQQIKEEEAIRTTFDLYYCGLVFFDQKRYKQDYKVNF